MVADCIIPKDLGVRRLWRDLKSRPKAAESEGSSPKSGLKKHLVAVDDVSHHSHHFGVPLQLVSRGRKYASPSCGPRPIGSVSGVLQR